MIPLTIILLILLTASWILSGKDVFNPGVLSSAIWLVMVGGYTLFSDDLVALSTQVKVAAGLWCVLFISASWLGQAISATPKVRIYSDHIKRIYWLASVCCIPLLIIFIINGLHYGATGNWALDLRLAALGQGRHQGDVYTPFYYMIWVITYLLYLSEEKPNWICTILLGTMVLGFGIATMSKTLILNFFLMTMFILFTKQVIRIRHILIGLVAVVLGLVGLQALRHNIHWREGALFEMVDQYVFMNLAAFDTLSPNSASHWGEHVCRLFYAISYKAGLSNVEPISPILPWVTSPVTTNTYTTMYPFFVDFGYSGIVVFALALGVGIGWLYKKAQTKDKLYTILYSYFMVMLVTQYNGDAFFTNLAGNIKFVLIAILPFVIHPIVDKIKTK